MKRDPEPQHRSLTEDSRHQNFSEPAFQLDVLLSCLLKRDDSFDTEYKQSYEVAGGRRLNLLKISVERVGKKTIKLHSR